MPYIPQERRDALAEDGAAQSHGELNYVITSWLLSTEPTSYDDFQALVGLLECIKLEFYRRAVAAYEDLKADLNGDLTWPE